MREISGSEEMCDPESSRLVDYYNRIDKLLCDAIVFWKPAVDWDSSLVQKKI